MLFNQLIDKLIDKTEKISERLRQKDIKAKEKALSFISKTKDFFMAYPIGLEPTAFRVGGQR